MPKKEAKNLMKGGLGSDGNYQLNFENGDLIFTVSYDGDGLDGEIRLILDPEYFIDKLADAIPGKLDDLILEGLKQAFFKSEDE